MTRDAAAAGDAVRAKAKIFVSYSRRDLAFADRIVAALQERGFEPQIDRAEIQAFEPWWKRIQGLIVAADTVVFVLSPDAVASDICRKEISFAASLNKRFAPIVCRAVDDTSVPETLASLNFVFFTEEARFAESADRLADALSTDLDWVRKHTWFGEQALRWSQAVPPRPRGLLLRSPVLEEAEHWIARRPEGGPAPTDTTLSFILDSRRGATRRRNVLTSSLGAGLALALVLAGLAFWQRSVAIEQERLAVRQRDAALVAQSRFLADRATQAREAGDAATGMLLSLAALPDAGAGEPRPYVPAAELALFEGERERRESVVLNGHTDTVDGAAFSPDGRRVVTASEDNTARIFDAATGVQIAALSGHSDKVRSAAFSPDGRRVLTASDDRTARIWDADTGAQIATLAHDDWVLSAAFSADGRRVVTASASQREPVRIWDTASGARIATFDQVTAVTRAAFSPDGRRVAIASQDRTVSVWDAAKGTRIASLTGHADAVNSAAFSPDGRRIVTASDDKTARIWDAASGAQVALLEGHEGGVTRAAFSPDGRQVMTAANDMTVRFWDAATQTPLAVLRGHGAAVQSAAFSPDGRRMVTASADMTARIWQAATRPWAAALVGSPGPMTRVAFSPDGRRIVTTAILPDTTALIWDMESGKRTAELVHDTPVLAAAFSLDGQTVMTASRGGIVRTWDAATGAPVSVRKGPDDQADRAAFSPDGKRIATVSADKAAIRDSATGAETVLTAHGGSLNGIAFSPDGGRVVTTSDDTTARIFDAATGAPIAVLTGHEGQVTGAAFSPDGRLVATASNDSTGRLWDAATGGLKAVLTGHAGVVVGVAFSPNGRLVMTVSADNTARIWNAATATPVAVLAYEASEQIGAAAFTPDGRRVLTTGGDRVARLWPIFPTTQDLVEDTKKVVPRCLTPRQREEAFLDPAPPAWCIEMKKWPYQTPDWQSWLRYRQANERPPLPDTPAWQAWMTAHGVK